MGNRSVWVRSRSPSRVWGNPPPMNRHAGKEVPTSSGRVRVPERRTLFDSRHSSRSMRLTSSQSPYSCPRSFYLPRLFVFSWYGSRHCPMQPPEPPTEPKSNQDYDQDNEPEQSLDNKHSKYEHTYGPDHYGEKGHPIQGKEDTEPSFHLFYINEEFDTSLRLFREQC